MAINSWYSKKDVLKDLHKATGKYVPDLNAVLVGEQPPPQPHMLDDDEDEDNLNMLRLYGGCKLQDAGSSVGDISKPDLAGIQRMLRLVAAEDPEPVSKRLLDKQKSPITDVITISKLNPEVQEFVPGRKLDLKTVTNTDTLIEALGDKISLSDKTRETKENLECTILETQKATDSDKDNVKLIEGRVDCNSLTENETKEMKEILKSTIIDTQKATCGRIRRTRNLAMATLLKLHCEPQPQSVVQKPVLMTPAHFEQCTNCPKEKKTTENLAEISSKVPNSMTIGKEKTVVNALTDDADKSEMNISVDKVQKWLDDSDNNKPKIVIEKADVEKNMTNLVVDKKETPSKAKSLYLGAITFNKRKATSKRSSPASSDSIETSRRPAYVPSKRAAELAKEYMERSETIQTINQSLWMNLEKDLKAKDKEILKKRMDLNSQPDSIATGMNNLSIHCSS